MEQAFNAIEDGDEPGEVMAILGLVSAGLVDFYSKRGGRTREEEFKEFCAVVKQCMSSMSVIEQRVH